MKNNKKQTYISMLKSNQNFLNNLDKNPTIDKYILAELMALYCINNMMNITNVYLLEMGKMNFYVDNDYLVIKGEKSSFDYIIDLIVSHYENSKPPKKEPILLNSSQETITTQIQQNKPINFKEENKKYYSLKRERLIKESVIDENSSLFIQSINTNFKVTTDDAVISLLKNKNTDSIDEVIIAFIYGMINLLINMEYNDELPLNIINIPDYKIALKKGKYTQEDIIELEQEEKTINEEITKQEKRIDFIRSYENNDKLIRTVEEYKRFLENRKYYLTGKIYELKRDKTTFSKIILSNLTKAIYQKSIELREEFIDPLLSIFTQTNNNIDCFIEMHLQTFINLFDNESLIKYYDNPPLYLKFISKG